MLLLVNLDSGSGAAIAANAKSQDVKVIDYDRLTLDGDSDYYVSFDNEKVGKLQGEGLVDCLGDKADAQVAVLNGSPTDNNATLFKNGYDGVINAKFDSGDWKEVADQSVPDWDNQKALTIFEQMLQKADNKIDGVLAANDGLGNAAISAIKQRKLDQIPVTGQDATLQGIQNIVAGDQCMTVYKAIKKEADAAAKLGIALAKGETPEASDSINNGTKDVPVGVPGAGRGDQGQHQGLPRRAGLPQEGRDLRRQAGVGLHRGRDLRTGIPGAPHRRPGVFPRRRIHSMSTSPILELRGVSKSFGAVQALYQVDFHVAPGEVMALVGDNGAGKSTLIKCIAGIHPIDEGEVVFDGEPVTSTAPRTPRSWASRSSTRTSRWPTTSTSCRTCSSAARRSTRIRRLDETTMEARARETLKGLSVTTIRSVRQTVAGLSGGQRQSVAVAKAVMWNSAWSSSTSRPRRSASRRPSRCSTSSRGSASRAWP